MTQGVPSFAVSFCEPLVPGPEPFATDAAAAAAAAAALLSLLLARAPPTALRPCEKDAMSDGARYGQGQDSRGEELNAHGVNNELTTQAHVRTSDVEPNNKVSNRKKKTGSDTYLHSLMNRPSSSQ